MHFRDGTPAQLGDCCRFRTSRYNQETKKQEGIYREGVIVNLTAGASTCNAQVAYAAVRDVSGVKVVTTETSYVTLAECDRAEVTIPDGK